MAKPNFGKPAQNENDDDDTFEADGLDDIQSKFLVPDDDYPLKLIDVKKDVSNAGNNMWVWTFTITGKKETGKEFSLWTALTAGALWKLEQVLVALGLHEEGQARIKFKKKEAIGRRCVGTFIAEPYKGRMSSKIDSVRPLEDEQEEATEEETEEEETEEEETEETEETEEEEEEEEPVKKPAKKPAAKPTTKKTTKKK